jgi:hypothetical protein
MRRNLSSSLGALHPILFLVMIYIISVVLAFFVCTTIYNSLHDTASVAEEERIHTEALTALK